MERSADRSLQPQYDWDLCIAHLSLAALLLFWSLARQTPQETAFDSGGFGAGEATPAAVMTLPARQSPLHDNGWNPAP
ncbi:MAG: hypothetical protein EBZ51_11040 [Synechococcaceae bacterium WB9_2_112]|nr:hypothetical protein [Synechococcaceae bacterium WB9_2_112]